MPGGLNKTKNEKTHKKLKQAQLPFKVLSPVTAATGTAGAGKSHPVKKRPFTKDEPGGTNAALPKKAKKSSSGSECVEVSSSSDEPRATSPRRRPRAPLDQFVRIEAPASEVSTSSDLVDLTSEDKENRGEPPPSDAEMTEVTEVKASKDAETVKTTADKDGSVAEADGKTELNKEETAEHVETNKSDDTNVAEKSAKDSDLLSAKSEKSSDEAENVAAASDTAEIQTAEKSDAPEVDSDVSSDIAEVKPGEKSDAPEAKTSQDAKAPSTISGKDAESPLSEPEKSPAKEPAPSADAAAAKVTKPVEDVDSTKTPESSPDTDPDTDNPATGDISDSEQDGDDADDESADDIVVLDETKPKPSEGGAANSEDSKTSGSTTPSTKGTSIAKKMTPKQKERERIRTKREQERQEEKQRREEEKEKIRKEKQEQKEKERKEKEEKREKERKEKEEKKENERLEKEKEKLEKQQQRAEKQKLIDEKKQAKEEKSRKDEEKRKAEEEEQRKLQKAKSMFSSFFVKKPKEAEVEQDDQKEEDNKLFQEFRVKEDMVLAPGARTALSACQSSQLEKALAVPEPLPADQLYLAELRSGRRKLQTRSRTLPPLEKDVEIIEEDDEDKELDGMAQDIVLSSAAAANRQLRYKLLMFRENRRPAYWGTWSKKCCDVKGRRPLGRAQILNYEEDSDDDWEEEDPNGESLSGSEKDVESEDDYEVDNEVFVPHGYLSDEEIKDEEEMISPEAQKARLKEKGEEFEKQMKKKTTALKPRLIGCVWQDESNTDPMFQQLLKLLRPFGVRALSTLPVPTVASGEVGGTPLAGTSPSDTPASSQAGFKFLKKFPDEALLPLARLVHGSPRGKPLLVREFATFWKRRAHGGSPRKADSAAAAAAPQTPSSAADGTPSVGPILSKKKIEDKLCDIATYTRCTAEGALQGRCCWMVRDDVLATLGVELPLPSQWKWITKTGLKRSKEMTPAASPAAVAAAEAAAAAVTAVEPGSAPERPRPATSLITKFAKVVTAEEARSELLSPPPAKRKIVPTKLISPQPPAVILPAQPKGIATFFKASPSAPTGLASSAVAAGGTPKRRLAPTPVGPRPGPSSAAAPARRLALTAMSAGPAASAAPARRLTPTAVPVGPPPAARRLVPIPVAAGSSTAALTPAAAPVPDSARAPATATAPAKAPEPPARKIPLISVPRGLPQVVELAKAAAANVETITLE